MPVTRQMKLPKTKDHKEFEKLVLDCLNTLHEEKTSIEFYFSLYGRDGQNQHGIDLISYDGKAVVQCKNYLSETGGDKLFEHVIRDISNNLAYFSSEDDLIDPVLAPA